MHCVMLKVLSYVHDTLAYLVQPGKYSQHLGQHACMEQLVASSIAMLHAIDLASTACKPAVDTHHVHCCIFLSTVSTLEPTVCLQRVTVKKFRELLHTAPHQLYYGCYEFKDEEDHQESEFLTVRQDCHEWILS